MVIQIDTREKQRAIEKIVKCFNDEGIKHYNSKLYAGDYMALENPKLVIDRKQNLSEVCSNLCNTKNHKRVVEELNRAAEVGIKVVFLVEHSSEINEMEDVIWWNNPRTIKRIQGPDGRWINIKTRATTGDTLYKIMKSFEENHNTKFYFCSKANTGKKIIELLQEGIDNEQGRD